MTLSKDACFYLGHVSKVRGFKGEVVLYLDVDSPRDYKSLKSVLIDMNGGLHPFFVESLKIDDQGFAIVTFEGMQTRDAAVAISGKDLYLPLDRLPALPDHKYYLHELEGMDVVDNVHGTLGKVEKMLDYSENPLLQLFRDGYEVLIPMQDAFVKKVDKKSRTIYVEIPIELLEINKI